MKQTLHHTLRSALAPTAFLMLLLASAPTQAQTLNVNVGEVTYAHSASQTGDMTFGSGTTLTIQNKTYRLSDITSITVSDDAVADNTVSVVYNGTSAAVTVAGNLAQYLTVKASGSHVSVVASNNCKQEITYTLSGTSTNGSFYMDGHYKARLALNALTLTNPDSAAIDIEDGKKIGVTLTGASSLTDGTGGSQKACFFVNGHVELSGTGSLTLAGNSKHAYFSDEYTEMKGGTLTVTSAASDGLHVNQYFQMDGGTLTIHSTGDGIDVGALDETADQNGQLIINGGTLSIVASGAASKGLKADSAITVSGGQISVQTTGDAYYDTTESDITSASAVKPGGAFTMTGGTLTATSTGEGGKGVNATGPVSISGGTLTVVTTGDVYEYGSDDTKPQGIKSDGNITVSGGSVYVAASADKGTAFKTDYVFTLSGGTVMGIGGKASTPASGGQTYKKYSGQTITGGKTVTYDGVSFAVPSIYSNSSAKVLVSSPQL
jgi:hypothetical protein